MRNDGVIVLIKIILTVIIFIILPVVLIPLLFSVINYLPEIFSYLSFNLGEEFFAEIQLSSYLSLYLAVVSIMVSVIIAYLLYQVEIQQKKREKQQQLNQNKEMIFFFFDRAIEQAFKSQQEIFWNSFDFVDINENIFTRLNVIKSLMSNEQFMFLNKLIDKLQRLSELELVDNYPLIRDEVVDLMKLITVPEYSILQFQLKKAETFYDLFNESAIEIYNILAPDDRQQIFFKDKIFNQNGNLILERDGDKTRIFNSDGHQICDAVFDSKGIVKGNAEIFDYEGNLKFEGEFENYQRNGQGVEYYYNRIKTKEGTWQDGELVDGIIYNVLLEDEETLFTDKPQFLHESEHLISLADTDNELLIGHLKVNDGDYRIMQNSLKKATEAF